LLKELKIGCGLNSRHEKEGRIEFFSSPNPMSDARWVELRDEMSVSLLQARLVECGHPIKIVVGGTLP
jgi:hypothetical protein